MVERGFTPKSARHHSRCFLIPEEGILGMGVLPWRACECVHTQLLLSCPGLCDPMDCSLPGSSVHGTLQERTLEWVSLLSSRGSSRHRDQTWISSPHAGSLRLNHGGAPSRTHSSLDCSYDGGKSRRFSGGTAGAGCSGPHCSVMPGKLPPCPHPQAQPVAPGRACWPQTQCHSHPGAPLGSS